MTVALDRKLEPNTFAEALKANPDGEAVVSTRGNNINIWLDKTGGYIALHWSATDIGKYDYVALYDHEPRGDAKGYMANQWQWTVNHSSPHVTNQWADGKVYWMAYCHWDGNGYAVQSQAGPYQS